MKLRSRIVFIGLIWTFVMGCGDVPEYSIVPSIELESLSFYDSPGTSDTLAIAIRFKDGDGDLGMDNTYNSDPYHPNNYIVVSNGSLVEIPTFNGYTSSPNPVRYYENVLDPGATNGVLAIDRTHDDPEYASLIPANEFPESCTSYLSSKVWLIGDDKRLIDENYNVINIDTLIDTSTSPSSALYLYQVEEVFYIRPNPNSRNISVEFFYKDGNDFKEFNWVTDVSPPDCGIPFSGRFPIITETSEPTEGVIRYYMGSSGFKPLLGTKELQLKIQIRDRGVIDSNTGLPVPKPSNIITTSSFTLNEIKK